ncbi:helix-turn-helix domain-containing protein [Kitasatospora acidiphila]|nr:helix-turn-helix transcriptional regulator [Kitasatospora acidiphila]
MTELPTMRSRRLGRELAALREGKNMTMGEVAAHLHCGQPKVSKIESGHQSVRPLDLDLMLTLYGVEDPPTREAFVRLSRQVRQQDWWSSQGPLLWEDLKDYLTLEADSSLTRTYEFHVLPGLLQTPDYMREVFRPNRSLREIDVMMETRQKRQDFFIARGTRVRLIIDVAALHRVVGSSKIMHAQLDRVLDMAQMPNLSIQVLPLRVPMQVPGQYAPYTIFTMAEAPHAEYVWLEHLTGATVLEREQDVTRYKQAWDDHTAAASPPGESLKYISEVMKEFA